MKKHFLNLLDCSPIELQGIIDRAICIKNDFHQGKANTIARGKVMAMIFEKASTRTRVSFETGMSQLGGSAIFLSSNDTQMGRGEPIEDSARVISSMVDVVMIRTFKQSDIETFAQYSRVPVINALTDAYHPCQLLADMQTYQEHRGAIKGKTVTWVGDGNNMCHSYINAAKQWGFTLNIATPENYEPNQALVAANAERIKLFNNPADACIGSDLIVTDTWASMGDEGEKSQREKSFAGYMISVDTMKSAAPDAVFLHCLPAYREKEVSAELLDHPDYSLVFEAAENRLHAQKALIEFLFTT